MNFLESCKASHEKMLPEWMKARKEVYVPSWDEYFMTIACLVGTRSQDAQTNYGAILVKNNRIIGTGYNSWPTGMDDKIIPNTRPYKYDAVIHAERNALNNCVVENPSGSICYVNGQPCLECLKDLVQNKILDFVIMQNDPKMFDKYTDNQKAVYYEIVSRHQVSFRQIEVGTKAINRAQEILTKSNGV